MTESPLTVVMIDDDPFILESLTTILQAYGRVKVAAASTSGADALALYRRFRPQVLLLDIRMPLVSGLAVAEEVLAAFPQANIVFLTTFADDDYLVRALTLGARGYLIKQDTAQLEQALFAAADGQTVLGQEVSGRVGQLMAKGRARTQQAGCDASSFGAQLSQREREAARLIAEGLDNREIAQALYLSEGTVRNYISAILQKTGLRDRTQIAIAWWRGSR